MLLHVCNGSTASGWSCGCHEHILIATILNGSTAKFCYFGIVCLVEYASIIHDVDKAIASLNTRPCLLELKTWGSHWWCLGLGGQKLEHRETSQIWLQDARLKPVHRHNPSGAANGSHLSRQAEKRSNTSQQRKTSISTVYRTQLNSNVTSSRVTDQKMDPPG